MRLLAIDLETSGLDPRKDRIIEVGAALWDTDRKVALQARSHLIHPPTGSDESFLEERITQLTGIAFEDLVEFGETFPDVARALGQLCEDADVRFLVGHNAREFDRSFLLAELGRFGCQGSWAETVTRLPWLDTMTDLPLPEDLKTRKLSHLAADHGFLNPFPHRALFDALTSLRLLSSYPLEEVIRYAGAPAVTLVAWNLPFERKDEAKNAGFQWDPAARRWFKTVKDFQVDALRGSVRFETRVVGKTA